MPQQNIFANSGDWLIPMLMKKAQEKRAERKKKDRQANILKDMRTIMGGGLLQPGQQGPEMSPEMIKSQKIDAAAGLASEGAGVPMNMLQDPIDVSALKVKYPGHDNIWDMVSKRELTVNQAMNIALTDKARPEDMTLEQAEEVISSGILKGTQYDGLDAEGFMQVSKARNIFSKHIGGTLTKAGGRKKSDFELKQESLASIIGDKTFGEIDDFDRGQLLIIGIDDDDLKEMYGIPSLSPTEAAQVRNELTETVMNWSSPMYSPFQRWMTNQKAPDKKEQALDDKFFPHFEKNYDKETGMAKWDYVRDKGIQQKILNNPITPKLRIQIDQAIAHLRAFPGTTVEDLRMDWVMARNKGTPQSLNRRELEIMLARLKLYFAEEE